MPTQPTTRKHTLVCALITLCLSGSTVYLLWAETGTRTQWQTTMNPSSWFIDSAHAQANSEMRLYKINRHGQSQRVRFTGKKSKIEGCHNLSIKSARVHRAVHFGFAQCSLFSEKDCASESVISAKLADDKPPQTRLTQGHSWFLGAEEKKDAFPKYSKEERGQKVRSWSCEGYAPPPIELN